jgi:hypothetical protein
MIYDIVAIKLLKSGGLKTLNDSTSQQLISYIIYLKSYIITSPPHHDFGKPNDLFVKIISFLYLRYYLAFQVFATINFSDGFVQVRVEFLVQCFHWLQALTRQCIAEFCEDQHDAFPDLLNVFRGFQLFLGPFAVVQNIQEFSDHILAGCLYQLDALTCIAALEIIKFSQLTKVPVIQLLYFWI